MAMSFGFTAMAEEGGVLVDRLRRDSGEMIEYVAVREDGTVAASPGAAFAPA